MANCRKQKSLKRFIGLCFRQLHCDPAGTRTQGPNIKSVMLYQLSYEINPFSFGSAKIAPTAFRSKII